MENSDIGNLCIAGLHMYAHCSFYFFDYCGIGRN